MPIEINISTTRGHKDDNRAGNDDTIYKDLP